ncbi:MAG: hypothetical protein KDK40_03500 [Chlamydiia bacterium]|nr:hypothetical protein [Chlamydiia bacterium]
MFKLSIWALALIIAFFGTDVSAIQCLDSPISELKVRELRPGLKLILLPLTSDEDEVSFRAIADGGFADFPSSQRASIELSAQIGLLSLQHQRKLRGIDLKFSVRAFDHSIDALLCSEEIPELAEILTELFITKPFTHGCAGLLTQRWGNALKTDIAANGFEAFELLYCSQLFEDPQPFTGLCRGSLDRFDFETAKDYFQNQFSVLDNYTFVLVGNFDADKATAAFEKAIQRLPPTPPSGTALPKILPKSLQIPEGIKKVKLGSEGCSRGSLRLVIPLNLSQDTASFHELQCMSQVIETRLRRTIKSIYGHSRGVDVAFEFPLVTSLDPAYLLIQVRQLEGHGDELTRVILNDLQKMVESELDGATIEAAQRQLETSRSLWTHESCYWVAMLGNFVLWGFDPSKADVPCPGDIVELQKQSLAFARQHFSPLRVIQITFDHPTHPPLF